MISKQLIQLWWNTKNCDETLKVMMKHLKVWWNTEKLWWNTEKFDETLKGCDETLKFIMKQWHLRAIVHRSYRGKLLSILTSFKVTLSYCVARSKGLNLIHHEIKNYGSLGTNYSKIFRFVEYVVKRPNKNNLLFCSRLFPYPACLPAELWWGLKFKTTMKTKLWVALAFPFLL